MMTRTIQSTGFAAYVDDNGHSRALEVSFSAECMLHLLSSPRQEKTTEFAESMTPF